MNDIAKNLKFCFDISKFKSMSQFCKVIGIDQANLNKKISESNTKYSFTKNDVQKICYNLGLRKEWLVNSDGDMFDNKAAVSPSDWVFGKDRTPNINMVNEENSHHNKQIVGDFSDNEINLLREQVAEANREKGHSNQAANGFACKEVGMQAICKRVNYKTTTTL